MLMSHQSSRVWLVGMHTDTATLKTWGLRVHTVKRTLIQGHIDF